jgi:stage V sporulation protein G
MEKMNVTRVKIRINGKETETKVKAYATVVLNDCFRISGIKVIDGQNGLFISFPRFQLANGQYQDLVSPVDKEGRKYIQEQVLNSFHSEIIAQTA